MNTTLQRVQILAAKGKIRISEHGYNELAADGLFVAQVLHGLEGALVVEDYPDYPKGPCVLVLQKDASGAAIHAVWGIPAGASEPAVLVTAYRPDPRRWDVDFLRRR
ncbi:MAG: DUF4258 domain-containing protein [Tepidisphaeraceae bacterium]|jgi:hypothetical protein